MKSNFKTFLFLSFLTILFIIAGGLIGGTQGAIIAFVLALMLLQQEEIRRMLQLQQQREFFRY